MKDNLESPVCLGVSAELRFGSAHVRVAVSAFIKAHENVPTGGGGHRDKMKKEEEEWMNPGGGGCSTLTWSVKVKHTYHSEEKNTPQGLKRET